MGIDEPDFKSLSYWTDAAEGLGIQRQPKKAAKAALSRFADLEGNALRTAMENALRDHPDRDKGRQSAKDGQGFFRK